MKAKIVVPLPNGQVEIHHHQTIRLSQSYNSAEVSYGAKLTVRDNPKIIQEQFARLENIVETHLVSKSQEQQKFLSQLAKGKE